ncbi:class I SAM-dependent methyltransferase [Luteolibacter pohnpeiensis]|uniref:Class I SAM-dependent methyltransferase n=1 Tax=Luteolibacter pohnpeiensis TaxID=454153 RepID=A0A934S1W0_9BACT|nr:class I SAM-dependent methyltransferase [Luteolibacter pohnpeiensis]MBK1880817.1 class I SAM-dependent methyltransferase [Luteolibacter pohnpeiensis]
MSKSIIPWIATDRVTSLLKELYADAAIKDPLARASASGIKPTGDDIPVFFKSMRKAYMAVGWEFGKLLYSLARTTHAKTIVEFGTSFGVSTIFLAAALRDNGGGKLITTEYDAEKSEQARRNLAATGLEEWVDFRVGDARESLTDSPDQIDMLFLDGAKELYIEVLKLLEPRFRSGSVIASDNTDHDGMESFLAYIQNPANGYISSAILTSGERGKAHEISIRH